MLLDKYFLRRSYAQGLEPFESIMDLPREEALRMEDAYMGKVSDRDNDPEKRIETYYNHRLDVEDWLRDEAIKQGIALLQKHPLYFRLMASAFNRHGPEYQPQHISIPVSNINLAACTFTIGDSFSNYRYVETNGKDRYGMPVHDYMGQVLTANKAEILAKQVASGLWEDDFYIEAQLWDRPKSKPDPRG